MGVFLVLLLGLLALPLCFVVHLYLTNQKRQAYFKKQGIPYLGYRLKETFRFFSGAINIVQAEEEIYDTITKFKEPMVAFSDPFGQALLIVHDLDLVKHIFVKDFDHFTNRRPMKTQRDGDYLKRMLISMESEQWKGIRAKLSPSFTTGRIRGMFQIFKSSSGRMDAYLKEQIKLKNPTERSMDGDFAQFFSKFAMDVIASCAFGVDSKTWEYTPEENSTFEKFGKEFGFKFTPGNLLRLILVFSAPKVADLLGIDAIGKEATQYFSQVIKTVMKRRRETGERQDDFLQLMMDAQAGLLKADEETKQVMNGTAAGDEDGKILKGEGLNKVTFEDADVIANSLLFLLAGFDTTQSALLFSIYSLALEPEVQEKLHKEVATVLKKHNGEMSYEAISEMTYLDMVVHETLRLYCPATRTERRCTQDYQVPGTNAVIKKDTIVLFPLLGIQRDPKHFPHPDKFIPERFTQENKASRHSYAFTPFGHGPRNCIGMRFALIKVKVAIAGLVHSFKIAPCSKTRIPVDYDVNASLKPKGGMWLNISIRE